MKQWLKRIRGAFGIALMWAVVWAPVGVLIGAFVDPTGAMDEPWWAVGAYPGFVGGLVFATVLRIAARRRRFDELSLPRFAAWGAAAGLVVGTLPFAIGTPTAAIPLWQLASVVIGPITLLSSISAAGSLALARRGQSRERLEGSDEGLPMLER